ncbi:bifunctional metallophosphatase/5'-nucleotidase [Methylobacterium sp. Leaf99]|uniref:bifunctional metallophosphatase/5'-nucleotidase n=1 Tax=Methylobacterium sp. Leaf99 TaxID=1736251 RepID=UPI000ABABC59|nr:bifunctional metallophosphatase/5'-nucleotidase [Methylobacterium sp. Leaf99]
MTYTLQILHASDWEAGLLATQRAANFAAIVDKLEDATPNSITLSTGDGWIPSPFFIAGADPQLAATYNGVYNQLYGLTGAAAYTRLAPSVGRADVTIQNIVGVQAAVFGNHEFDSGPTEVANIIGANLGAAPGNADDTWVGAQFPYLSTNLNFSREAALSGLVNPNVSNATFAQTGPASTQTGTGADKIARSAILVENGEKIAFVGATTQVEPLLTTLGNVTVDGFDGRDNIPLLAQQINAEIDRVLAANPDVNKVIVGTHLQQLANEQALAPLLRNVDVLIGGGSHTLLADGDDRLLSGDTAAGAYPQFHTNASGQTLVLVNTASEYSYVGRLNVTFDDKGNILRDSVNPATSGAVAVDDATVAGLYGSTAAAFTPSSKGFLVREVIEGLDVNNDGVQETAGIADVIRAQDGNILGRSNVYLEGRRGEVRTEETNLGDLTSDANLWYAKQFDAGVTVSIKNGGGIRDSIGSFSTSGGGTSELPPAANPSAGKQAGDISQLDVTNSLRFNNNLAIVTVTASELERVLEHGVAAVAAGATPGQFTQVGGISYSFDATKQAQTHWSWDTKLVGSVHDLSFKADPFADIDGAFTATVKARFDDLDAGAWQRVYDFGNGPDIDSVWLGQVGTSSDMQFSVVNGGKVGQVIAKNAIVEGKEATWTTSVNEAGWMRLFKDGAVVAEGQGLVPRDVDRANEFVGKSNWSDVKPLVGKVSDLVITPHKAIPEIDGAFKMFAEVRFDDLDSGYFQRVFDTGNGADSNNIWLGQEWNGDDMVFEILTGSTKHRITAPDTIVEGEMAKWQASVDESGYMRLLKNSALVAEGQGAVPLDVVRTSDLIGKSNWSPDGALVGQINELIFI